MPVPKISRLTLDNATWTAIKTNKDCIYFTITNSSGLVVKLRSDVSDALTEMTLQPLQDYPPGAAFKNLSPYRAAETVAFGQLASGGPASVTLVCV